jgi:hypothetical protein
MIGEQLYSFDRGVLRWLGAALGTGVVLFGRNAARMDGRACSHLTARDQGSCNTPDCRQN